MKISLASDLHLEFGDLDFDNQDNAEVLILGGDICVANDIAQRDPYNVMGPDYRSTRYHEFFQRCSARFPHVIYIVGNHEHYHSDFSATVPHFQDVLSYLPNLYVLEKQAKTIGDVTFLAGTLWTDLNDEDQQTITHIRRYMSDFRVIQNGDRRFTPEDTINEHRAMLEFIIESIADAPVNKYVVVGHHAPSKASTKPKYQDDILVNGAYSSALDSFILDHPQIKLWTHGHTHDPFDYMVGSTRVMCNPRGYHGYEDRADEWKLVTVDI